MMKIQDQKSFWGSGMELAEKATLCARELAIEGEKINLRLIRYYASEGIINRPDRLGKEAAYNYLHLLQLLVARKMVQGGAPLGTVRVFNHSASVPDLERALVGELSDEARKVIEVIAMKEQSYKDEYKRRQNNKDFSDILKIIKNLETQWEESTKKTREREEYESVKRLENRRSNRLILERIMEERDLLMKTADEALKRINEIEQQNRCEMEEMKYALQNSIKEQERKYQEMQSTLQEYLLRIENHLDLIEKKNQRSNG